MMIVKSFIGLTLISLAVAGYVSVAAPANTYADDVCGAGNTQTKVAIDIGCEGKGNAIADMLFAFIRILSDGVGLVVVASIIWAGIMYITSQGNPQETAKAQARIRSSLIALLLFIFSYAILNYLIPGQFLQ